MKPFCLTSPRLLASLCLLLAACGPTPTPTTSTAPPPPAGTTPAPSGTGTATTGAPVTLLNVSYDVARDYYKDVNPAFTKAYRAAGGPDVTVNQSHNGSSAQVRAVLDGLEADVVTMNQQTDVDKLAEAGFVAKDWRTRLPENSAPYFSTMFFLVRQGNPKGIRDWGDLVKPDVKVIIPNPKLTGNGRYSYLGAWAWARRQPGGSDASAREFVTKLFKNVPVLDSGGRAATGTFAQRGIGDVLITFESEVNVIKNDPTLGAGGKLEAVVPAASILAEAPVALVEKFADKHGTRAAAEAYLRYLFSEEGQELAAKYYYRPRSAAVTARYPDRFPKVALFTVDDVFGGWANAQRTHFAEGGVFDQIYKP